MAFLILHVDQLIFGNHYPVILRDPDAVVSYPVVLVVQAGRGCRGHLSIGKQPDEFLSVVFLKDKAPHRVRAVDLPDVAIQRHVHRVERFNPQLLVEAVLVDEVVDDMPAAKAAFQLGFLGLTVDGLEIGNILDVPDQFLPHLRRVVADLVADRLDLRLRRVLLRLIGQLVDDVLGSIDGQAGPVVLVPIFLDRIRPLPTVVGIAIGKLDVLDIELPPAAFPFLPALEPLLGLIDNLCFRVDRLRRLVRDVLPARGFGHAHRPA